MNRNWDPFEDLCCDLAAIAADALVYGTNEWKLSVCPLCTKAWWTAGDGSWETDGLALGEDFVQRFRKAKQSEARI